MGYRQLWAYFDGDFRSDEAVRRGIFATRQLAKRQLTWLRSELELIRINPHEGGGSVRTLERAGAARPSRLPSNATNADATVQFETFTAWSARRGAMLRCRPVGLRCFGGTLLA